MGFLRYILAAAVVLSHSKLNFTWLPAGDVAVQSFFMISGFYMALILNEQYAKPVPFWLNRLLRIIPMYWLVLIITILVHHYFLRSLFRLEPSAQALAAFTNVFVFGQDILFYLTRNLEWVTSPLGVGEKRLYSNLANPVSWTLSLELMFYLMAPFVVKSLKRIVILALLSLALRLYLISKGFTEDPFTYRLFPQELLFFCLGAFSWHLLHTLRSFKPEFLQAAAKPVTIALLAILCVFTLVPLPHSSMLPLWYLCLTLGLPFMFEATANSKISNRIGEISYPLYLCHILILERTIKLAPNLAETNPALISFYGLIAATLMAIILHYIVEKPLAPLRRKLRLAGAK